MTIRQRADPQRVIFSALGALGLAKGADSFFLICQCLGTIIPYSVPEDLGYSVCTMTTSTSMISKQPLVVNVASVPQRSPFRYPGGKTWLVPYLRAWLRSLPKRPMFFIEPFAGGAITSLTVSAENLADKVILGELDDDVAAVWHTILSGHAGWLVGRIVDFEITRSNVLEALGHTAKSTRELAFQTILRNRVNRGGIMAPGASMVKQGENGRGIASRWYPGTLARRIFAIAAMKERMAFFHGDALAWIGDYLHNPDTVFFVDPPYTAGGKRAGKRLYVHNQVDHESLFGLMARAMGPVMLTYDDSTDVRALAKRHGLSVHMVPMKNTHHALLHELIITNGKGRVPSGLTPRTLFPQHASA